MVIRVKHAYRGPWMHAWKQRNMHGYRVHVWKRGKMHGRMDFFFGYGEIYGSQMQTGRTAVN